MATEKRLIDANPVIDKLKSHHDLFVDAWGGFGNLPEKDKARVDEISSCIAELFNVPTVDAVEVVHGRWIVKEHSAPYGGYHLFHCSECDEPNAKEKNYCPNCGAKMDGGVDRGL